MRLVVTNLWFPFLAALALVFSVDFRFLHRGFFEDDYFFLALVPKLGFRTLHLFSPYLKWFYRPLFLVYFSSVLTIFGRSSTAFHAFSLVLEAANIALLYALVSKISGRAADALVAAALFFVVTIRSESVCWISCTSTLFAGMFYLLVLLGWIRYRETGDKRWYVAAAAAMACALLSKEDAVSVPAVLLIMDLLLYRDKLALKRSVCEFGVLAAIIALYLILDITAARLVVWPGNNGLLPTSVSTRLMPVSSFLGNVIGTILPCTASVTSYGWPVWILIAAACAGARRHPGVLLFVLALVVCAMPTPIAGGGHTFSARFYFIPLQMLCALLASGALSLVRTGTRENISAAQIVVTGTIAPVVWFFLPAPIDAMTMWIALMVMLVIYWICARERVLQYWMASALTVTGIIPILFAVYAPASTPTIVAPLVTIALSSIVNLRRAWWQSAALAVIFYEFPAIYAGVFLATALSWTAVEKLTSKA